MRETEYIVALLHKYLKDELAPTEQNDLEDWANSHPAYRQLLDELKDETQLRAELRTFDAVYGDAEEIVVTRMLARIKNGIDDKETSVRRLPIWRWTAIAAAILLVSAIGLYFFSGGQETITKSEMQVIDIPPGSNKAVLMLADGTTVDLNNDKNGIVINAENLTYSDGTEIDVPNHNSSAIAFNSIVTPKGGQYQIILSDGTKVWLNAASTLRYPSKFSKEKREVELIGEAYFEVNPARNPKAGNRPFIVKTQGQEITVLGTVFNLTAYPDENETRTTLIEGSLKVSKAGSTGLKNQSSVLKAGEETVLDDTGVLITRSADITYALAWRNGNFYFKNTSFEALMRQIARWYDIDVQYEGAVPQEFFTGEMNRNVNLSTVIDFLKGSGINFRMEGKKLIINK